MTTNETRAANPEVARTGDWSQALNITLDVSAAVLTTLKDAAKMSPVPYLPAVALVALSIVEVVQKMRSNRGRFQELAKKSCDIVYEMINAQKDVSQTGDVPIDLEKHLEWLLDDLRSIEEFARKGASRNTLVAVFQSGADARKIQKYKSKLDQAIYLFGLRSDITLRKDMAQVKKQLNVISRVIVPPSSHPSLLTLTKILRRAPNDTSVVDFEALFHLEKILSMDFKVMSTQITDQQDKKILIKFVNNVRHAKLLAWSRLKDGDRRAQHLLTVLKRRGMTTRSTYPWSRLKDGGRRAQHLLTVLKRRRITTRNTYPLSRLKDGGRRAQHLLTVLKRRGITTRNTYRSRLKDGDRRAQHLLTVLKRRGTTTRNKYRHIKVSVSHLFKRSKKQSEE